MKTMTLWSSMLVLWVAVVTPAMAEDAPLFDVPRLKTISIDGNSADWGDQGFRIGALTSIERKMPLADDLDAGFRLGWDQRGLLVLVIVSDDVGVEHPNEGELLRVWALLPEAYSDRASKATVLGGRKRGIRNMAERNYEAFMSHVSDEALFGVCLFPVLYGKDNSKDYSHKNERCKHDYEFHFSPPYLWESQNRLIGQRYKQLIPVQILLVGIFSHQ